jgi:hypothetical protein
MHVKVFFGGTYINASSYYSDASYAHTGQLFFNDTLRNLVALQSPYSNHSGSRMLNSADNIHATTGAYTLMNIQYVNSASGMSGGLIAAITLGVTSTSSSSDTTAATTSGTIATASMNTISTGLSSCGGGRAGGRPFWLW